MRSEWGSVLLAGLAACWGCAGANQEKDGGADGRDATIGSGGSTAAGGGAGIGGRAGTGGAAGAGGRAGTGGAAGAGETGGAAAGGAATGGAATGGAATGGAATGGAATGGAATGGSASGGAATGGGQTGGAVATGGAGGGAVACPDSRDVISDFGTGGTAVVNPVSPRSGAWYIYYQGDGSNPAEPPNPGVTIPLRSNTALPRDTTMGGPCSGAGSFRLQARDITGWGIGVATSLVPDMNGRHGLYDASAYQGLRAWVRCTTNIQHVNLIIPDGNTDFDAPSPLCPSYSDCSSHGSWNNTVGPDGKFIDVSFATATQSPNRPSVTTIPHIDKTRLTSIRLMIEAHFASGVAQPISFDCFIDDVFFY
jgi:hypothetical protein